MPMRRNDLIQKSSEIEKLQELRGKIAENSRNLIGLFRERAFLAKEIGRVKRENGLPPRIREREEEVLEGLGDMDNLSRSIMSSLFEFSIINEHEGDSREARSLLEKSEFCVRGSTNDLETLAGLLISRPGVDVYADKTLPENFKEGIQANGGHIISGEHSNPDITLCLGVVQDTCDFSISRDGEMKYRLKFPVKKGDVIVKVVQQ